MFKVDKENTRMMSITSSFEIRNKIDMSLSLETKSIKIMTEFGGF